MAKIYKKESDFFLPITYTDVFDKGKISEPSIKKKKLLWIGTYFGPNVHGLFWFIERVLPFINDVELCVLGYNTEKLKGKISDNKVKVIGTVEDLSPYYYDADAVVQPIFYGSGMKTKTAQILMYGKAMFATDEAIEGYDCNGSEHIYRVNTAEEYIDAISAFFRGKHKKYYDDVRKVFLDNHCTEKKENEFIDFLRKSI